MRHIQADLLVVIAADTDTFTLIIYIFFCKISPADKRYMKVDKNRYVDTSKVCNSCSKEIYDAFTPSISDVTQHLIAIKLGK